MARSSGIGSPIRSRGPAIAPGGNGCGGFQTTAAPAFVNPTADDYHLAPGSPMIDMGDPAAPAVGILDLIGVLAGWGAPGACDLDGGGTGIGDLLEVLASWGPCP